MAVGSNAGKGTGYFTNGMPVVTGVSLSAGSSIPVDTGLSRGQSPQSGAMIPGTLPIPSGQEAVTAFPTGGKANAVQLGYGVNNITVCATAANSVLLPYAYPGSLAFVRNGGAQSTTVFGKGTDTIDAVATATGNAQAAAKGKLYFGVSGNGDGTNAGAWVTLLGA